MIINTVIVDGVVYWTVKYNGEYWNTPVTDNSLQGLMNLIYMSELA